MPKYNVVITPSLDDDWQNSAYLMMVNKEEALRRAFALLKAAVESEKVILIKDGIEREFIVK